MTIPTIAPGQTPYTEEEWAKVRRLIADAAEFDEMASEEDKREAEYWKRSAEIDLHGGEQ